MKPWRVRRFVFGRWPCRVTWWFVTRELADYEIIGPFDNLHEAQKERNWCARNC